MDKHQLEGTFPLPNHDGETYVPGLDKVRLNSQLRRVFDLMKDGAWRTLDEIRAVAGGSEAGISARLRDLRKGKFGGYEVMSRRRGEGRDGLHEYCLTADKNRETYPHAPDLVPYAQPKPPAGTIKPITTLLGLVTVREARL